MLIFHLITLVSAQEVMHVIELCRHGARSPYEFQAWDNLESWPQGEGQLTPAGMRQHFLIGHELRNKYIIKSQLLSQNFSQYEISLFSTDVTRTLQSAECQLQGLYPPGTGPDLRVEAMKAKSVPPIDISDLDPSVLGMKALPNNAQTVPVHTKRNSLDYSLLAEDACAMYRKEKSEIENFEDPSFFPFIEQYKDLISTVAAYYNKTFNESIYTTLTVYDSVVCNQFQGYDSHIPSEFSSRLEELTSFYNSYHSLAYHPNQKMNILAGGEMLKTFYGIFNSTIHNTTTKKFSLFSAHDTTVSSLLSVLGIDYDGQPPFASTVFLELLYERDSYYAALYYNGRVQNIKDCNSAICPIEDFKRVVSENSVPDIEEACKVIQQTVDAKALQPSMSYKFHYNHENDFMLLWYFWFILAIFTIAIVGAYCFLRRRAVNQSFKDLMEFDSETH